jgi:hypothetical protein
MTVLVNSKQFKNPISGSFTGSFVGNLSGTSSYATTASYADNFTINNSLTASGSINFTGSMLVTGSIRLASGGAITVPTITYQTSLSSNGGELVISQNQIRNDKNGTIVWGGTAGVNSFRDVGVRRNTSGSVEIYDGTTADGTIANRRDLIARNITGSLSGSADFATSSSYAATSSFANNFTVAGTLTAQTIVVQTITSSISFLTGSTRHGSLLTDTHQFTGSVGITGSLAVNGTTAILGTGTTNYVPKFTSSTVVGNSNIQDNGSIIVLGSNTSISSGALGIGTVLLSGNNLVIAKNLTGATDTNSIYNNVTAQSDVINTAIGFRSTISTQGVASYNLNILSHFFVSQGTIGGGSSINTQIGFWVNSNIIGGTNNYGYRGSIPSGTGRYNLYMDGTANNYLAGSLGIGTGKTVPNATLDISGSVLITGSLSISPSSSFVLPLTASASPTVGSVYWSGSLLFIYNGTRYMSSSFA